MSEWHDNYTVFVSNSYARPAVVHEYGTEKKNQYGQWRAWSKCGRRMTDRLIVGLLDRSKVRPCRTCWPQSVRSPLLGPCICDGERHPEASDE